MDLPLSGPAVALAGAVRVALPVVMAAGVAGALIARGGTPGGSQVALPPWHPWGPLAAQLAAFCGTAAVAVALLGRGASPPGAVALAALVACAAVTAALAVLVAVPAGWALRGWNRWRIPLLALAAGALAWRAASLAESLWKPLTAVTLGSAAWLLEATTGAATLDADRALVGARGFVVHVAPVCSGVDGLGLVVAFQALWIALARRRVRAGRALCVLLPLGAAAAVAANGVRVALLVLVGASGRPELAIGGFHSKLGWLLFVGIALASVAAAERLPLLRRAGARGAEPALPEGAAAFLAPFLAMLATALVTSAWAAGPLDRAYGARVVAGGLALALARRALPSPALVRGWLPLAVGGAAAALWLARPAGDGADLAAAVAALAPAERTLWIAARIAGSCAFVPVVEELAFRGFLLPWLVSPRVDRVPLRAWTPGAVLASSLAFGLVHEAWLAGTVAGVLFAVARLWRGRLSDAIVAHASCNAAIAVAVLAFGRWDLWS